MAEDKNAAEQGTDTTPLSTIGRPTTFTQDLADAICAELATGQSMRSISRDENMPAMSTMFKWLREMPEFSEQYARAKQESADAMAEEILDISDDGSNDWMEKHYGDNTVWVTNGEALQRSRLRVDTRKFLMAKMKPKVYGEKLDLTTGGEKLNRGASDAELDAILARERATADQASQNPQT